MLAEGRDSLFGGTFFCFRLTRHRVQGRFDELNETNSGRVQRGGSSYLECAGRRKVALRGCVQNYRTSERDMERLLKTCGQRQGEGASS